MRNKILKWLGIDLLPIESKENFRAWHELQARVTELELQKRQSDMYLKGVINYLDIDFVSEVIPHPYMIPEIPPTMKVLTAKKHKKIK